MKSALIGSNRFLPPPAIAAFPDLIINPAESTVTLGRDSQITARHRSESVLSELLIRRDWYIAQRFHPPAPASSATFRRSFAIPLIRCSFNSKRSTIAGDKTLPPLRHLRHLPQECPYIDSNKSARLNKKRSFGLSLPSQEFCSLFLHPDPFEELFSSCFPLIILS